MSHDPKKKKKIKHLILINCQGPELKFSVLKNQRRKTYLVMTFKIKGGGRRVSKKQTNPLLSSRSSY